ncbi:SURF1 family protein [Afifella sp. IM 167]|uniref:SURF1 family protein n=1 Tax=Afifella sp. IM 167 TaxID=2033586 RepID=UPI001CCE68AC|nr:SURF1 family protein [Afifella sp. IM 167]MBZ8133452.1 surfeit 1 [Afifella sp. IM 167]
MSAEDGTAEGTARRAGPVRLVVTGIVALVAIAILVSLGNWQVRRLAWKEDLIARVAERPAMPPLPAAVIFQPDAAANEYRRVVLSGRYLAAKEVRVFTSLPSDEARGPASGPGAWIMTPFELADGGVILVNRGFVPDGAEWAPPPSGEIEISGLIRPDDPPTWLTPENKPGEDLFFSRSIEAISAAENLTGRLAPVTLDLLRSEEGPELPQAGETRMLFPNNHLQYALTWYGLAVALVVVFLSYAVGARRRRP